MKDAFNRRINEGDIVVYVTRRSSSQYVHVAKVLKSEDHRIRVQVMASTGWGRVDRKVTLRTPHNVIVANGMDAYGVRDAQLARQR